MTNKKLTFICSAILSVSGVMGNASAACLAASGKISNNVQADGTTLGTVALTLGRQKLKCGISGAPQFPGPPDFRHTIVCDDKAADGEAQAQVTFNTSFMSAPVVTDFCPDGSPGGVVAISFEEISIPDPQTARGTFKGITTDGAIIIQGDLNCDGGINMKFAGELCFSE